MESEFHRELTKLYSDLTRIETLTKKVGEMLESNRYEAENLISKAVTALLEKSKNGSLPPIGNIEAYIFVCARNKFRDDKRKSKKEDSYPSDFFQENYGNTEIDLLGEQFQVRKMLEEYGEYILEHLEEFLPEEIDRNIVKGRYYEGKTYKEIHEDLLEKKIDIKVTALRQRNGRALRKIKQKLQAEYPEIKRHIHKSKPYE